MTAMAPKTDRPGILKLPWLKAFFCLMTCVLGPMSMQAADTLTNATAVLALSADEASSGIPVSVTGVVTAAETNWTGRFFVQDSSGGIFVQLITNCQPVPGDVVQVWGISSPGGYAPVITKPHWTKLGTDLLPKAKRVSSERLMSGAEDSQRVEVSGIVRTAEFNGSRVGIELVSSGYRFRAFFPPSPAVDPQSLIGARVLVRGTAAAAFFNAPLRHFITVTLFVPGAEDIIVEQAAPANPFGKPLVPLNSIAQYRHDPPLGYQVHVKGIVTYQRKGESLFLQDANGGLEVKTTSTNAVVPGEMVEAVGFPAVANYLPVLEDTVFHEATNAPVKLEANPASVEELQKGLHHADFVVLRGRLIDRLVAGVGSGVNGNSIRTTLVLQDSNVVFVAEKETSEPNTFLGAIPIGSLVEARGICLLDGSSDGKIKSFRLLLPTSHDVSVIEKPSWLTPQHLLATLMSLFAVLLVAIGWTIWVSNKNSVLQSLVQEKEAAQGELQQAHDQLEERVRERTAQLKVEMTARKESELQFRAVLTERTRLAQELHDTLEQTLTGIALQQDLVASQFAKNPDSAVQHLKLARNLMRQSQADLHRSVWGLRSRAEEEFNLTSALITSVRQITGDTGVRVVTETIGDSGQLSEIIEENLLRIGQEAATNTVKHAGATMLKIELHFSPQKVVLQIHDDGKGFDPETCAGPKDGHFGLLGIRERTERLGGQVKITSAPNAGTSIRVEIPTRPHDGKVPAPSTNGNHEERV
jgi:signal transduction histidine kinase